MKKSLFVFAIAFSLIENSNAQRNTVLLGDILGTIGAVVAGSNAQGINDAVRDDGGPARLHRAREALEKTHRPNSAYSGVLISTEKSKYRDSREQFACKQAFTTGNRLATETRLAIYHNPELMKAPQHMTLAECVVLLGGRVEDMDTPENRAAKEEAERLAKVEAQAVAVAAAKAKAEEDARIEESERPAREAARIKAEADLKAFHERLAAEQKEREAAQKAAEAKRIAGLKSGTIAPTSMADFKLKHGDVPNGAVFGSAPKVSPDGKPYFIAGIIKLADEGHAVMIAQQDDNAALASAFMRSQGIEPSTPKYVVVRFPKGTVRAKFMQIGQIEGKILVFGRYVDNDRIKLVSGQAVQVPVFEADAVY